MNTTEPIEGGLQTSLQTVLGSANTFIIYLHRAHAVVGLTLLPRGV